MLSLIECGVPMPRPMLYPSICHHLFDDYSERSVKRVVDLVSEMGFEGIELLGEPAYYPQNVDRIVRAGGLQVSAITAASRLTTGRDLTHAAPEARAATRLHIERCVDFAERVGCGLVGVALTAVGRFHKDKDEEAERLRIAEALDWLETTGRQRGVIFGIEVLNRYSSAYLNGPRDLDLLGGDRPHVKLTLDTFHLLTELESVEQLSEVGELVVNVQVSGGARGTVRRSLIDPGVFVSILAAHGYAGPVTLEAFPPGLAPFSDVATGASQSTLDLARDFLSWFRESSPKWNARPADSNEQRVLSTTGEGGARGVE